MALQFGRIHSINRDRGFGFIDSDGGSDNIFFHVRELSDFDGDDSAQWRAFRPGDPVSFEIKQTPKGPRAFNVEGVAA